MRGINASIELIRRPRGGNWPTGPVIEDFNYVDLVRHECEFRERESFTYTVYASEQYLGGCYLYPLGRRKPLTEELCDHDVDVSWWVTPDAYATGQDTKLYRTLCGWTTTEFPFTKGHYSNASVAVERRPGIGCSKLAMQESGVLEGALMSYPNSWDRTQFPWKFLIMRVVWTLVFTVVAAVLALPLLGIGGCGTEAACYSRRRASPAFPRMSMSGSSPHRSRESLPGWRTRKSTGDPSTQFERSAHVYRFRLSAGSCASRPGNHCSDTGEWDGKHA